MSSRDRREDDLEERLDELEDVLAELRTDLQPENEGRRGSPRPPRFSELLRFTEQYTIPTLIALLETTIKSLELLRGTLRLADPGRDLDLESEGRVTEDRLAGVRDEASAGLARSLSELRTALSTADLPEDAASRSLLEDAHDLTAEIESLVEDGRRRADAARRPDPATRDADENPTRDAADRERADGAISIDVTDPADDPTDPADGTHDSGGSDDTGGGSGDGATDSDDTSTTTADGPNVDVDAELESIKRQLGETSERRNAAGTVPDEDRGSSPSDVERATGKPTGDESDAEGSDSGDNGSATSGDDETG